MNSRQVHEQYKNTGIKTANREELLLKLYRGAISFLNQAEKAIEREDIQQANNLLIRVQEIVNELRFNLDRKKGGEVADNLYRLYDYMYRTLVRANVRKDTGKIDTVRTIFEELLEAWEGAAKKVAKNKSYPGTTGNVNISAK